MKQVITLFVAYLFTSGAVWAQNTRDLLQEGESGSLDQYILSVYPKPGEVVTSDELFLLVRFEEIFRATAIAANAVHLAIDSRDVTALTERSLYHVSLIVKEPLESGHHTIALTVELPSGRERFEWRFVLERRGRDPGESSTQSQIALVNGQPIPQDKLNFLSRANKKVDEIPKAPTRFVGNVSARSRQLDLKGPGRALRQEPIKTNELDVAATLSVGGIGITPVISLTSDETRTAQPRDRVSLGLEAGPVEVWLGDAYPRYHDLILKGLRVRGGEVNVEMNGWTLGVSHGEIQRATLPATPTSTTTFRRELTAVRAAYSWSEAGFRLGVTGLKAHDLASSSRSAQNPQRNEVYGADFEFRPSAAWRLFGEFGQGDLEGDSGLAVIDDGGDSAVRLGLEYKVGQSSLFAELFRVDTGYRSLGRPTLRTDQEGFRLATIDRFRQGKLRLRGGFHHWRDNLAGQLPSARQNDELDAAIEIRLGEAWPTVSLNGRWLVRADGLSPSQPFAIDEERRSYGLGLRKATGWRAGTTSWLLELRSNDREDRVQTRGNVDATTLRAVLQHGFKAPWFLRLAWSQNDREVAAAVADTTVVTLAFWGKLLDGRLKIEARSTARFSDGAAPGFDSRRLLSTLRAEWELPRNFSFHLDLEHGEFEDMANPGNDFRETALLFSFAYEFDIEGF